MAAQKHLKFTDSVWIYPLLFVMAIWIVYWAEGQYGLNFNKFGIYPRKVEGLRGILFGPFIHGSLKHLFNNSVPLFVLGTALFYFYQDIRWKVLLYGLLLTGLLTWIVGRPSFHIGASGVIYMLAAFLFFKGIFSGMFRLIAISLVVVFLYGGMLWYLFPIDPLISWEGHMSGFLVGLLFAFIFKGNPVETKKYAWQREDFIPQNDPFLRQFDENGNFFELPKDAPEGMNTEETSNSIRVIYTVKKEAPKEN